MSTTTLLPFELSDDKKALLKSSGHILALGGPGSGKTTIALLKAKQIIEEGLKNGQKVLFLSFARATIARVDQQARVIVTNLLRNHLEINTYHGFAWNILKSHGYLLNGGVKLRLLPPPEAASILAAIENKMLEKEKNRLFQKEGLLHFDLFAGLTADLLTKSKTLAQLVSNVYPVIILDEFQDTNADEWRLIRQLGSGSKLIALADLEQRIYEFRGADPERINEFIKTYEPVQYDFGEENNRSNGTDIVKYGNDLLTGKNKGKDYTNVHLKRYSIRKGNATHLVLKAEILNAFQRLRQGGSNNWSIAVLVPTKKLMVSVSDFLATKQSLPGKRYLPEISHNVSMDMEGPSLAANLISCLMEKGTTDEQLQKMLLGRLYEHIRGRNGAGAISQANLTLTDAMKEYLSNGKVRGSNRILIISEALRISEACRKLVFTGDPINDWLFVRKLLFESSSEVIKQVALDAQYLRLLRKGALLSSGLSNLWRSTGTYNGASTLVRNALAQEHFSAVVTEWKGLHVMTMHKAKGKEFDEVIIYEGLYQGRIAWNGQTAKQYRQSRLALRVAVTRAMKRVTIITPTEDPCTLVF